MKELAEASRKLLEGMIVGGRDEIPEPVLWQFEGKLTAGGYG